MFSAVGTEPSPNDLDDGRGDAGYLPRIARPDDRRLADLEVGMQVRVSGTEDEGGSIDARSVVVTPEGFEDFRGSGGG